MYTVFVVEVHLDNWYIWCSVVRLWTLWCIVLHCIALYCIALHCRMKTSDLAAQLSADGALGALSAVGALLYLELVLLVH